MSRLCVLAILVLLLVLAQRAAGDVEASYYPWVFVPMASPARALPADLARDWTNGPRRCRYRCFPDRLRYVWSDGLELRCYCGFGRAGLPARAVYDVLMPPALYEPVGEEIP